VDHPVRMTRFRVWFQPEVNTAELGSAVWNRVRLAQRPLAFGIDAVDVTVVGNGGDLRRLLSERRDSFAALIAAQPESARCQAHRQCGHPCQKSILCRPFSCPTRPFGPPVSVWPDPDKVPLASQARSVRGSD